MKNYKKGELKARKILERYYNISFDDCYYDDNKLYKMPDFRLSDGRFLEVTKTKHNEDVNVNNIVYESLEKWKNRLEKERDAYEAVKNIENYINKDGSINISKYNYDCKILRKYSGYNPQTGDYTENKFSGTRWYSVDNIINVVLEKNKKHKGKDIDLFVYADTEEVNLLIEDADKFTKKIKDVVFKNVYVCEWNIFFSKICENSRLLKFSIINHYCELESVKNINTEEIENGNL